MSHEDAELPDDIYSEALPPGSKLLSGQYEIVQYLSSGGFGITYLARDSLNRTVVIKECFPEAFCSRVNKTVRARTRNYSDDFRSIVALFIREAHALSRLDHSSVVGVHQVFEDNETAYMALDLVDGRDLLDLIENDTVSFSPGEVYRMALALLDAIGHVHAQDLLHRDISPDNILVDKSGRPVLIDFGAAREEASRKSRVLSQVLVVKDGYSPQEFYVAGSQQSPSSDLYALAATLSHLISGQAPPNSQARLAALAGNQPDLYEPLRGRFPDYEDAFLEAIDKAMNIVPAARIQSAEEWTLMIDHGKRAEQARARAMDDKTIDLTVMNLVKSVNRDLQETATSVTAAAPAAAQADDSETKPDKPAPKAVIEDLTWSAEEYEGFADDEPAARETPYARIVEAAQRMRREPKGRRWSLRISMRRAATIPVIFFAYFFYGQAALQYEQVQAATVDPIVRLGEEFRTWNEPDKANIEISRGTGG
ncbi:serine/threonine-protein kinase [Roseobacter sp.]|uniref:serine/threonine-protein kinase n=1 Tax=Roseobacter sp. TaxID=1907202 RepID=UPI0025D1E270|nr:serine/threonine-protein kinase [Roseobacter sp.]